MRRPYEADGGGAGRPCILDSFNVPLGGATGETASPAGLPAASESMRAPRPRGPPRAERPRRRARTESGAAAPGGPPAPRPQAPRTSRGAANASAASTSARKARPARGSRLRTTAAPPGSPRGLRGGSAGAASRAGLRTSRGIGRRLRRLIRFLVRPQLGPDGLPRHRRVRVAPVLRPTLGDERALGRTQGQRPRLRTERIPGAWTRARRSAAGRATRAARSTVVRTMVGICRAAVWAATRRLTSGSARGSNVAPAADGTRHRTSPYDGVRVRRLTPDFSRGAAITGPSRHVGRWAAPSAATIR